MINLQNKRLVLGISGGIAAYKSAELVRELRRLGASVRVVMTAGAQAFITPLTLQALSGNPVHTELLDPLAEAGMGHIELAKWADLIIVAPASANFIARLAVGQADDLLTTVCLATQAPLAVAPAMNQAMWTNPATQQNMRTLAIRDIRIWGPADGDQACGDVGPGRMLESAKIAGLCADEFQPQTLAGMTVVVTAGPTREPLDPVRYLSNHSSGKMGYALAAAARDAGAKTILISGPTALPEPARVQVIRINTGEQMLNQCLSLASTADVFISAAAVADYRATEVAAQKIKKDSSEYLELKLSKNPDIVAAVANLAKRPFVVGFAAETQNIIENAQTKLVSKKLDLIIANDVSNPELGFNSDENAVWLIDRDNIVQLTRRSKQQLARDIVSDIARRLADVSTIGKIPRGN